MLAGEMGGGFAEGLAILPQRYDFPTAPPAVVPVTVPAFALPFSFGSFFLFVLAFVLVLWLAWNLWCRLAWPTRLG